jgi:hypothetical protein
MSRNIMVPSIYCRSNAKVERLHYSLKLLIVSKTNIGVFKFSNVAPLGRLVRASFYCKALSKRLAEVLQFNPHYSYSPHGSFGF